MERFEAITHTGTHVDAPYGPLSEGLPARRIFAHPGLGRDARDGWLSSAFASSASTRIRDRPFANMVDGRFIWPAHFAGIRREYCQIEKLANLDLLPRPHGFYVSCLPVKIDCARAAWRRAVALFPE